MARSFRHRNPTGLFCGLAAMLIVVEGGVAIGILSALERFVTYDS
jgi:hypothetical protein